MIDTFFKKISTPITEIVDQQNGNVLNCKEASNEVNRYVCQISVTLSSKFTGKPIYSDDLSPEHYHAG